jgi:molybdopterin synthase sulfur carrier subunit
MADNCEISMLYFAAASTATKKSAERITLPTPDLDPSAPSEFRLSHLIELLISRYPNTNLAKIIKDSLWSVDAEMVEKPPEEVILKGGEEVAIICPVSGG